MSESESTPIDEPQRILVSDVVDLMTDDLVLAEVKQYSLFAQRKDVELEGSSTTPEPDVSMELSVRGSLGWMESRFKIKVETTEAAIESDVGVIYRFFEGADLSAEVQRDFIQKVAVMTAYPYLRESVATLASRLGISLAPLGVLRQGAFEVGLPEAELGAP